jgi:hypothetical protein
MYFFEFHVEPATDSGYFRRNFMKNLGKLAILGAVLASSASFAFGSTIQLASYGQAGLSGYDPVVTGTGLANSATQFVASATESTFAAISSQAAAVAAGTNLSSLNGYSATGAGTAYELNPSTVWSTPLPTPPASAWVGSTAASGPVGTVNVPYGYYEYTTTISGLATGYTGSLSVLADDTTEVFLNGVSIISFGAFGGDNHCADNVPNCSIVDTVGLALPAGTDTLTFVVEQNGNEASNSGPGLNGNPSGLAFDATLSSVPEPNSLMLLGTGLLGAGGMLMRRRRVTA